MKYFSNIVIIIYILPTHSTNGIQIHQHGHCCHHTGVSRLDSEDLGEDLTSTFALAAVIFMFHVSYSDQNAMQLKCSVE